MTHSSRYIHSQIWRMAWPMILSNLSRPLLGAVDTAVMGHMSAPHFLGAVAIGGLIFNFLYWSFAFLRMATTGLAAQAWGHADHDELRAILGRALLLACSIAGLMLMLQSPIGAVSFNLIESSPASDALARHYYAIRIWSAPAALANYALIDWFLGTQNPRLPRPL